MLIFDAKAINNPVCKYIILSRVIILTPVIRYGLG